MLRGLSRIGSRYYPTVSVWYVFSRFPFFQTHRGILDVSVEKKRFDVAPLQIDRQKIFFPRWISFEAFRPRSRGRGEWRNKRKSKGTNREGKGANLVRRWERLEFIKAFRKLEMRTWDREIGERTALNRESFLIRSWITDLSTRIRKL